MGSSERKYARMIFKRLKAGIVSYDDLSDEELEILMRHYGWLLRR